MTEKKDPTFKLATTAKEFVPKERKSIDKPEQTTGTEKMAPTTETAQKGAATALNPSAKEFVPKLASPSMMPALSPVMCFVPAYLPPSEELPAEGESPEEGMLEPAPKLEDKKSKREGERKSTFAKESGERKLSNHRFVIPHIEKPEKVYAISYLMLYKKKCHRKPKDMRMIDMPLRSKEGNPPAKLGQLEEADTAESIRNLRILLNKLSRDNFARISDTIMNNFVYNKEILQALVVFLSIKITFYRACSLANL